MTEGPLVFVGFGFEVEVGVEGKNIDAAVEVAVGTAVYVIVVKEGVVGTTVEVCDVGVSVGYGVPTANVAPGVRKTLIQAGCVRMDASTGSKNPCGLSVRKSLFGSRFESIFVFSVQLGAKCSAHSPAAITHRNPMIRIIGIMNQSRRSGSGAFMA